MKRFLHDEHIIFTPENPMHPTMHGQNPSIEDVTSFLRNNGENAEIIEGMYDKPERSILVNSPKNVKGLFDMAKGFGQDSLIHSVGGEHKLHYLNGPNAGQHIAGSGTKFLREKPDNHYSTIHTEEGPLHFQHQFDFGKSENLQKSPLPYTDHIPSESGFKNPEDIPNKKKLTEVTLPNGLIYRQYHGLKGFDPNVHGHREHYLFDPQGTAPLAYLQTAHVDDPMSEHGFWPHAVQLSEVDPDYKGKGLGRQLYLATLLHGTKHLTSDSKISPEAHNAWKSFKGLPGLSGKIGRYPKNAEMPVGPSLIQSYENDRHQVFVKDPSKLDQNRMFPAVDLHDEKLASSEKSEITLDSLKSQLESEDAPEALTIPEHLQIQWAVPIHRWNK